ncbi:MAG: type II secretion system protein GspM [Gammaproteobacteria bacterium]
MNAWWQGLDQRERGLVSIMGVMIVVAMVYFFVLEPLFSGARSYSERVATAEKDLEYMKRVSPTLKQSGGASSGNRAQPGGNRTLLSIIDQTTKQFDLKPRGSTQSGSDKLRVQFPASSFNAMISWFGELHSKYGVEIDAVSLTREDDNPGVVSGSVTIAKP